MKALEEFILGKWVRVNTFSKKEITSTIDQILSDRLSEGLLVETSTNIIHLIKFLVSASQNLNSPIVSNTQYLEP